MRSTTDTYIYPINFRKRDYQYEIVRACFLENTLVALPTGLGKTFIAGVVLLNCESLDPSRRTHVSIANVSVAFPLVYRW
jgi:ATP-dependent DNA helicase MPH1